jgi:hypothetical protein
MNRGIYIGMWCHDYFSVFGFFQGLPFLLAPSFSYTLSVWNQGSSWYNLPQGGFGVKLSPINLVKEGVDCQPVVDMFCDSVRKSEGGEKARDTRRLAVQ